MSIPVRLEVPIVSVDLVRAARRSDDLRGIPLPTLEQDAHDYERFLLLNRAHPNEPVAPTKRIDRLWHLHMLHPRAYVADCMKLFGEILDHDGGFGASPDEAPVLKEVFAKTAALWEQMFGEPYIGEPDSMVKCTRNCVSRCKRACKTASRGCSC